MKEDQMLALLAKLCGDITFAENTDPAKTLQLQESIASTLINYPGASISSEFQFEKINDPLQKKTDLKKLEGLGGILQRAKAGNLTVDANTMVFRREVPLVSSQVKGSVPEWARGAAIKETIGPVLGPDGRKFWFDLYKTIPLVQVSLQGAAMPFLLIPLTINTISVIGRGPKKFTIPKGSAWINAHLFAADAPQNLYCGVSIKASEITLSGQLNVTADNKLVLPPGMEASVVLNLEQQVVSDVSPDENGIDAKEATINLPSTLSFTVKNSGQTISITDADWNLYGQAIKFSFDKTKAMHWRPELNRVAIPFRQNTADFAIRKSKSPTVTLSGQAKIAEAFWALPAAVININAPLEAEGTGAMAIAILDGIRLGWLGLKDANLFEKSEALLQNALVMLMPGRINISTLFASNITGRQRYNLWQDTLDNGELETPQHIDLQYTKQFFLFYDCLQKGTETIAAQANCRGSINKPVQVTGRPFPLKSLQTLYMLSMSKALQLVMLLDDNIIQDNFINSTPVLPGTAAPVVTFKSTALALNNALLTVSPINGMLLYGDLKDENNFDKCLIVFTFGMLQYLPTLPDPYAANVGLLRRRLRGPNNEALENKHTLAEMTSLLVCLINWQNMDAPAVNFFMGDKPQAAAAAAAVSNRFTVTDSRVKLNDLKNAQVLGSAQQNAFSRNTSLQANKWTAASDDQQFSGSMVNTESKQMMSVTRGVSRDSPSPFVNAFALLDVSTNADLMGISVGIGRNEFVFERTHTVDNMDGGLLSIQGMDMHANSRLVQIYALPQISWEPMINLSEVTNSTQDPYPGILYFMNDGVPAQIANTNNTQVNLAPIPVTQKTAEWYNEQNITLWNYFTLSNGMLAMGIFTKNSDGTKPVFKLIKESFPGEFETALQIKTEGFFDTKNKHKKFLGSAHQLSNVNNLFFPTTNNRSVLSGSVTEIFNDEFGTLTGFQLSKYIPLERYDFSGYGANVFSHWVNANAALAQTSQAMFDVWRGRTAHEVIQVKSVIYPWAVRVVRTITIYRGANGFPWRTDSGWKAESDGIYDFRTPIKDDPAVQAALNQEKARTYVFHPGMVEGVYNVRNIKEDSTLAPFTKTWNKTTGVFINDQGHPESVGGGKSLDVKLVPVYFDADVKIDNVTQGATDGKVLSRRMLGYLQLRPRGVFIDAEDFASLLNLQQGLGGPVDCMVNIQQGGQMMRVSRVEVNPSLNGSDRVFVTAAKGTPVLPKDGSWSVVEHDATTKEVQPLSGNNVIPLIREGKRIFQDGLQSYTQDKLSKAVNVAESSELFKPLESRLKQYGFLQSTGENKVLFRNPLFESGAAKDILKGSIPDLADAYHLMNSKGIFPKLEELPKVTEMAGDYVMKIKEEGYKLLNKVNPEKMLEQAIPEGPWYIVKTEFVKVYIAYKSGSQPSKLNLDIDSTAQKWMNKMNDITMYVDLGPMEKLLLIRGKFDTKKGEAPKFIEPILEFGPQLEPVYEILLLLSQLSVNPSYKDILKAGLKIAMSNSPDNWEYKFQADKEIPVLRFPPPNLDTAAAPLRLEASLKAGVYFNVAIPLPPTNGLPAPSAGAFVEFFGKMSVMCVSVGVGTIYAVGQVTVRISADTVIGPALYMKFGFGVEAVVALPVIGSVSVYFAVGVEMNLDSTQIAIAGFVLFKGRAEILGGIVTVTIQIEAAGEVQKRIGNASTGETNMKARVTFSLDISICFIIDISFTEQWEEQRKIA